jgi:peroxiredoxin
VLSAGLVLVTSLAVLFAYSPPGTGSPLVYRHARSTAPAASIADARLAGSVNRDGAGSILPRSALPDTEGNAFELSALRGHPVVLFFSSMDCPMTSRYQSRVAQLARRYRQLDPEVRFVALNQDIGAATRHDALEVRVQTKVVDRPFPTLLDIDRRVAHRLGVASTPDFIVIDSKGVERYRGPFDDSADVSKVTRHFVAEALERVLGTRQHRVAAAPADDADASLAMKNRG